jgi:hypothetical protein
MAEINWAQTSLLNGCVDIGQISKEQKKELDKLVKQGKLLRYRHPWLGYMKEKTHYAPMSKVIETETHYIVSL